MRILPINYNFHTQWHRSEETKMQNCQTVIANPPITSTFLSFQGVGSGSKPLKELVKYGVYDMYTGLRLLEPKYVEDLLKKSFYLKPLSEIVKVIEKQRDTLNKTDTAILEELKKVSEKETNIRIDDAIKILKPEHEKKLLNIQQPIFEELIEKACDLPDETYSNFIELMNLTNKRLLRAPVVMPFSAKEFIYKLQRAREEIRSKNNIQEIQAINRLIHSARIIFELPVQSTNIYSKRQLNRKDKLKNQMQKETLKINSKKFKALRDIFDDSVLRNNKELRHIFKTTSAKIHGFPAILPFKRKEFVHDLKNVLRGEKNKTLKQDLITIAHKLPTSIENVSAFIVKYSNDSPEKILFSLLKNSISSVDHIKPTNLGGKNNISNFGLCSTYINTIKTNIPFKKWLEIYPQTRQNCQKYIDRMIELYNKGIFKKVGLSRNYITDFADTIKELSPEENPIILNLNKLNM